MSRCRGIVLGTGHSFFGDRRAGCLRGSLEARSTGVQVAWGWSTSHAVLAKMPGLAPRGNGSYWKALSSGGG